MSSQGLPKSDYSKNDEDKAKALNVQQSPGINPDADKLKGRFILRK